MSKSNIQSLDHIDLSKTAHAIKFLKNEIKFGASVDVNEESNQETFYNNYCKNELTCKTYSFLKNSVEELDLYRVMPLDGTEKMYFDSKDEYYTWFRKNSKRRSVYNPYHVNGMCG